MFGKIFKIFFYFLFIAAIIMVIARYIFSISYLPIKIHSKYYTESNLALAGYDMTSYFDEEKAHKGMELYYVKWDDFNWIFTKTPHLKMFKENPKKYIPQFGGYDSYWITYNIAYPPDPKIFYIYHGKLYLFSSEENKEIFLSDIENSIAVAKANWNN